MGSIPISFQEIKAYSDLMGLEFTPQEVLTLKQMSNSYVSQSHDKGLMSKRPYIDIEQAKNYNNSDDIKRAFDIF